MEETTARKQRIILPKPLVHLICPFTLLPTKIRLVEAMVFPAVVYGCESWTIKKADHQRTEAFEW